MTRIRSLVIGLLVLAVSVAFALYFYSAEREHQMEMMQPEVPEQALVMEGDADEAALVEVELTLLRRDSGSAGTPRFRKEKVEIPIIEDLAARAEEIVNVVLRHSEAWIPTSARVLQVYLLEDGTAVVDLAPEVAELRSGGIDAELGLLESITASLRTNIPEIEAVRFVVGGRERSTLSGHVSIRRPFR